MGRGVHLTKAEKRLRRQTLATELGKQDAEARKPFDVSLREHIGKAIDRIKANDVIDIAAWLGLAYIIKPILDVNEEIQAKVVLVKAVGKHVDKKVFQGLPVWEIVSSVIPVIPAVAAITPTPEELKKELEKTDWQTWLLALAISALLIKFGPSILSGLSGGVVGLGKLLLAI
jgi:hypothetical protein